MACYDETIDFKNAFHNAEYIWHKRNVTFVNKNRHDKKAGHQEFDLIECK